MEATVSPLPIGFFPPFCFHFPLSWPQMNIWTFEEWKAKRSNVIWKYWEWMRAGWLWRAIERLQWEPLAHFRFRRSKWCQIFCVLQPGSFDSASRETYLQLTLWEAIFLTHSLGFFLHLPANGWNGAKFFAFCNQVRSIRLFPKRISTSIWKTKFFSPIHFAIFQRHSKMGETTPLMCHSTSGSIRFRFWWIEFRHGMLKCKFMYLFLLNGRYAIPAF